MEQGVNFKTIQGEIVEYHLSDNQLSFPKEYLEYFAEEIENFKAKSMKEILVWDEDIEIEVPMLYYTK